MKKITLIFAVLLFVSCTTSKVKDIASFQFNNAWYWVVQYEDGTTKQEIEDYVNTYSNPNQTSYFFVFDNSTDLSFFQKEKFDLKRFYETILLNSPKYGYYKMMPNDTKLYDDGISILKLSTK